MLLKYINQMDDGFCLSQCELILDFICITYNVCVHLPFVLLSSSLMVYNREHVCFLVRFPVDFIKTLSMIYYIVILKTRNH